MSIQPKLIHSFIERGILTFNTTLKAIIPIRDMTGVFSSQNERHVLFKKIITEKNEMFFMVSSIDKDSTLYKISIDAVLEIDGMEPERLARSFSLKDDGTEKITKLDPITGRELRRGRKPKWVLEKIKEANQN